VPRLFAATAVVTFKTEAPNVPKNCPNFIATGVRGLPAVKKKTIKTMNGQPTKACQCVGGTALIAAQSVAEVPDSKL
jgi:hypothetical protein